VNERRYQYSLHVQIGSQTIQYPSGQVYLIETLSRLIPILNNFFI
jgi:hypothetical protein